MFADHKVHPLRTPASVNGLLMVGLLCLTLFAGGCSRGKQLAPVKGEVLQHGIAVPHAWIDFVPEFPEESSIFQGRTNEQGQFELIYTGTAKGATVGKYTVMIGTGDLPNPNGGDTKTPRVLLHEQKGVEVKPGENEFLFEIRGEMPPAS